MPSLGFKTQFAKLVIKGLRHPDPRPIQFRIELGDVLGKRQTIRIPRKNPILPGHTLYLFTGMRTKNCVRIGEAKCTEAIRISINYAGIFLRNPKWFYQIPDDKLNHFATMDGFVDWANMLTFFLQGETQEFHGDLIVW